MAKKQEIAVYMKRRGKNGKLEFKLVTDVEEVKGLRSKGWRTATAKEAQAQNDA